MTGWLANVNKLILSASEVSNYFDSYLHDRRGLLIESGGPIARGILREINRLCRAHRDSQTMNLDKTRGMYHLWVPIEKKQGYPLNATDIKRAGCQYQGKPRQG